MEHAYAVALWNMIEKGAKPSEAIAAMRKSLMARGREKLLPKIARAFSRIAHREESKQRVTLSVAREGDLAHARKEVAKLLVQYGVEPKDMKTAIDANLVGGWRVECRGVLIDASWKKDLLSIYNRATQ